MIANRKEEQDIMKKKIVPIIIVIVVVVAAFFVYFNFLKPTSQETGDPQMSALEDVYYYVPGDYFVTNINDSLALCKTSVALALTGKDQSSFLDTNVAVVRNSVIKVLISHTEEELRSSSAIDMLEDEMTASLKSALGIETLQKVYISDFVIQ